MGQFAESRSLRFGERLTDAGQQDRAPGRPTIVAKPRLTASRWGSLSASRRVNKALMSRMPGRESAAAERRTVASGKAWAWPGSPGARAARGE